MNRPHIIKFKTNGIPLFEISSNPLVYEILQYIKNIEENNNIFTPLLEKFNETINNNTDLQFPKLLTNGRSTEGLIKFAVGIYNGNTIDIQPHPIEIVEHDTKGTNYLPYLSVNIDNDKIKEIIYKTLQYIIDSNYFDTKLKKGEYIRFVIELYHNRKINDIPNFHRDLQGEYESLMLFLCYENYSGSDSNLFGEKHSDSDLFGEKESDSDLFGEKESDTDSDLFGGKNKIQKGGDILSAEFNLSCNEENNNSFRFLLKYPYNTIYSQNLVHSTAFATAPTNFTPRSIMRRLSKNEAELLLHGSSRNFVRIVATKHSNNSSKIPHDAQIIKKKICFKQKQKTIKYKNKKNKKNKKSKKIKRKRKLKNYCSMNSNNLTININNLNDQNITSFINDCISNNISDAVQLKG